MGDDSIPLIPAGIVFVTVVSMFAGGSVMVGDALSGMMPW